jgi:hypothetical protein
MYISIIYEVGLFWGATQFMDWLPYQQEKQKQEQVVIRRFLLLLFVSNTIHKIYSSPNIYQLHKNNICIYNKSEIYLHDCNYISYCNYMLMAISCILLAL